MTGLTRPVTRDLQKVLTRLKMQQQAVADGRPIPEDRTDVMDLPHLFKPTSAGLHHAARKLGENPLPEEEPGIPIPGIFGPMDRQPTPEEEELNIFRTDPGPHRVRPATGDILPEELLEEQRAANRDRQSRSDEANEARERKQKEDQPKQKADETQGKTANKAEKSPEAMKGKEMTEQDRAAEMVDQAQTHPTEEQQRAIDEAKAENVRLEAAQKREAEAAAIARGESVATTTTEQPSAERDKGRGESGSTTTTTTTTTTAQPKAR